ncbi:transposase [Bradyrhizobium tunisiense]|uniref:transposase n=1 Tax=Bradyrhizobium tunisiense TaxID=3278709 RepID=UPI0035D89D6F
MQARNGVAEIDRAMAAGVRFGCVQADAGYGLSAPFRQGLIERGLAWTVGIPRHLAVNSSDGDSTVLNRPIYPGAGPRTASSPSHTRGGSRMP